jgi:hypothetical protein
MRSLSWRCYARHSSIAQCQGAGSGARLMACQAIGLKAAAVKLNGGCGWIPARRTQWRGVQYAVYACSPRGDAPGAGRLLTESVGQSVRSTTQAASRSDCCCRGTCGDHAHMRSLSYHARSSSIEQCQDIWQWRPPNMARELLQPCQKALWMRLGPTRCSQWRTRCAVQYVMHACGVRGGSSWRRRAAHSPSRPVSALHDAGSVPDRKLSRRVVQPPHRTHVLPVMSVLRSSSSEQCQDSSQRCPAHGLKAAAASQKAWWMRLDPSPPQAVAHCEKRCACDSNVTAA